MARKINNEKLIFPSTGRGKTNKEKLELANYNVLSKNDDIIIVDPDSECITNAEDIKGETVLITDFKTKVKK